MVRVVLVGRVEGFDLGYLLFVQFDLSLIGPDGILRSWLGLSELYDTVLLLVYLVAFRFSAALKILDKHPLLFGGRQALRSRWIR